MECITKATDFILIEAANSIDFFSFRKTQLCQLADFTIDSHSHLYLLQQNKNFQNIFLSRKNRAENRLYDQKLSRHLFLREKCRIKLQNWPIFVNSTRKKKLGTAIKYSKEWKTFWYDTSRNPKIHATKIRNQILCVGFVALKFKRVENAKSFYVEFKTAWSKVWELRFEMRFQALAKLK